MPRASFRFVGGAVITAVIAASLLFMAKSASLRMGNLKTEPVSAVMAQDAASVCTNCEDSDSRLNNLIVANAAERSRSAAQIARLVAERDSLSRRVAELEQANPPSTVNATTGAPVTLPLLGDRAFLDYCNAIAMQETRGEPDPDNARGSAGELGRYQIMPAYWSDAVEHGRSSRSPTTAANIQHDFENLRNPAYGRLIMMLYAHRYEPDALARMDVETLARLHHGGPNWRNRPHTDEYWTGVRRFIDSGPAASANP